jgi:hypothetical protein
MAENIVRQMIGYQSDRDWTKSLALVRALGHFHAFATLSGSRKNVSVESITFVPAPSPERLYRGGSSRGIFWTDEVVWAWGLAQTIHRNTDVWEATSPSILASITLSGIKTEFNPIEYLVAPRSLKAVSKCDHPDYLYLTGAER